MHDAGKNGRLFRRARQRNTCNADEGRRWIFSWNQLTRDRSQAKKEHAWLHRGENLILFGLFSAAAKLFCSAARLLQDATLRRPQEQHVRAMPAAEFDISKYTGYVADLLRTTTLILL